MSARADSLKSVLYALGANFGIAIARSVAAVITKSGSMLAEAIHSFADCGNQALWLWGMKGAKVQAALINEIEQGLKRESAQVKRVSFEPDTVR